MAKKTKPIAWVVQRSNGVDDEEARALRKAAILDHPDCDVRVTTEPRFDEERGDVLIFTSATKPKPKRKKAPAKKKAAAKKSAAKSDDGEAGAKIENEG